MNYEIEVRSYPCVAELILSEVSRGEGRDRSDPCRRVIQVYEKDGRFVAENDSWLDVQAMKDRIDRAEVLLRALRAKHEALSDGDRERIDRFFDPAPL